ncbi:hypothetical protein [Massilia sp.]|uniref:hypothetical protein n=1 Tax=Massilia sp. TaxID=1882437 RepID=UPI00289C3C86|nr:hypothetical protein [Massilia sp.]
MPLPALPHTSYLRLIRASAIHDMVQILPFATPWTFALLYAQLSRLNVWFGAAPLPAFQTVHLLLATLLGTLVLTWTSCRLWAPSLRLGRFDAGARLIFAVWIGWAMLVADMPMLWVFLMPEIFWGCAQCWPVALPSAPRAAVTRQSAAAPHAQP